MLWVLKRTVSMKRLFWAPKTYVKIDRQENIYNFTLKIFVYLNLCWLKHLCVLIPTSELRVRLARRESGLSPSVKYFTYHSKAVLLLWIFYVISVLFLLCSWLSFVIFQLWSCHFPIGILGQVWCLIVSIPDIFAPFLTNSLHVLLLLPADFFSI